MNAIINTNTGARMFPYCPLWTLDDWCGNVKLERKDGTHTYANIYCPPDMNPYVGQGRWYIHHTKPAYLVRMGGIFYMGTKEELEKTLELLENEH